MAIQTSGTITMTNIVTEFGGTAPHALSEYYRGAGLVPDTATNINVPTSGTISFSDFYGAADSLWETTVSVGFTSASGFNFFGFDSNAPGYGSLSDTTCDFKADTSVTRLRWIQGPPSNNIRFEVKGNQTNDGFTTMTVDSSISFLRAFAFYAYVSSTDTTYWDWGQSTNPFGAAGSSVVVTFT